MAVHIIEDGYGTGTIVSDRALYTDASGTRLLEEGDADAAVLVVSHPGKPIPAEFVASLGLEVDKGGKVKQRKGAANDKELAVSGSKDATPPKDDGTVGAPIRAYGADDVAAMSKAALKEIAKGRHVPGYTKMNEDELRAAIVEGGAMQQGGINPDQATGAGE